MLIAVPSRRWLRGAAALAPVALAGLVWPGAAGLLLALDLAWLLLLALDAARAPAVTDLAVTRDAPPAFSIGRVAGVTYRWRHRHPRAVRLRVRERLPGPLGGAESPTRRLVVPPGAGLDERLELRPARRGVGEGGELAVRALGPLGLAWRQGTVALPWRATVFPDLAGASTRALPVQAARRREAGSRSVRRPGEGRLFEALREWVPGEDTRLIDWKATARRGKPIARQYEDERRQRVMLLLDAGRLLTAETAGAARLESAVTAALHLAHAAVEHDDDVGLLVFADEVQRFVPAARGRRALRAVAEGLAAAEGRLVESDYPAAFRHLAGRSRKRALTVLFTDVIDRTASDALLAHAAGLRPRHLAVAVTLRDPALEALASARPENAPAAFERAAAEALLDAREAALAEMRGRGIVVLDVGPRGAAREVVECYRRLKRRGVL